MKCTDCMYCENDYFTKMTACNYPDFYRPPRLMFEPSEGCERFKEKTKPVDDKILVEMATNYFNIHEVQGTLEEFIEYCRKMNK